MTADARSQLTEALDVAMEDAYHHSIYRWPQQEDLPRIADFLAPVVARIVAAELRDFADLVDRGPAVPLPPSVFSALARERADGIDRDGDAR